MRGPSLQAVAGRSRVPTQRCVVCDAQTREHKPVCPDHIFEEPYPKRLRDLVEEAEQEVIAAGGKRGMSAIDSLGLVVSEILSALAVNGELTWRSLARDHVSFLNGAKQESIDAYLSRIKKDGLVNVRVTFRSVEVVTLSAKGRERLQK